MTSTATLMRAVSRPLPLEGAANVRDLGGYPIAGNPRHVTARGAFLRGDDLSALSAQDVASLTAYGLSLDIDVRSARELGEAPDVFENPADADGVRYASVPLLDGMNSAGFEGPLPSSLEEIYRVLLDADAYGLARVMELMAAETGAVLFHCSAGKDRTGVIAMLLLKLADVADEDVVADYAASAGYMEARFRAQRTALAKRGIAAPDFLFASEPETMKRTLIHLARRYGSAEHYLLEAAGVNPASVAIIKNRLQGGL